MAEAILFGGTLPANCRRIGRELLGTKEGVEIFSWGIILSPIQPLSQFGSSAGRLDLGIGFSVWLMNRTKNKLAVG